MVSDKTLKAYDFKTIEDYFQYIVLSKINGQHAQVVSLIKAMSLHQKKHCLIWFDEQCVSDHVQYCKSKLIEAL